MAGSHCVATIATFTANINSGYELYLLFFSPLEDEICNAADSHYNSLKYITSHFGKKFDNVPDIIANNCAENRRLHRLADTHSLGFASHRYNLVVKNVIYSNKTLIENVRKVMSCLRYALRREKLRVTILAPVHFVETSWSSMNSLLDRFVHIRESHLKHSIPELDD